MLHIEVLVEDASGEEALKAFLPKFLPEQVTFRIFAYRGIGRLPPGLTPDTDPVKRLLLDQLPRLLAGYGKNFASDPPDYRRYVLVICDLDNKDLAEFEREIKTAVEMLHPLPRWGLCLAVEEGEAWLLGDAEAVIQAYPQVNQAILKRYVLDSICGTWELMADLLYRGGARVLSRKPYFEIGAEKCRWAKTIAPLVEPSRHNSPSFHKFAETLKSMQLEGS